jgi:hypothetical protein
MNVKKVVEKPKAAAAGRKLRDSAHSTRHGGPGPREARSITRSSTMTLDVLFWTVFNAGYREHLTTPFQFDHYTCSPSVAYTYVCTIIQLLGSHYYHYR